jgi:hypothetical protein
MTRRAFLTLCLCLVGCSVEPPNGTSIGNPSMTALSIALSDDVELTEAELSLADLEMVDSDRNFEVFHIDSTIDLLAGEPIELPAGDWLVMNLFPSEPLTLAGSTRSGEPASFVLDVPEISLRPDLDSLSSDGDHFVLELAFPGWLNADYAGYDPDLEIVVDPASLHHDRLVAAIRDRSALYGDQNRNGQVDDEDRAGGERARGRHRGR